jgi:hypothetical protein
MDLMARKPSDGRVLPRVSKLRMRLTIAIGYFYVTLHEKGWTE